MSSKRGRKRNDNLPPNRARDVQRAFRARRAAHLQALEQRVTELEEENACLRQELNLPPANRPPLGKGPTGKDKPKSFDATSRPSHPDSRESSSADSPSSTRANSLSPSDLVSIRNAPRTVHMIDSGNWEQSLLIHDQQFDAQLSASSASPYQLPAVTPVSSKTLHYSPYSNPVPSSTRNSVSNVMFMAPPPQANHSHSTDRPMGGAYSSAFMIRNDVRHDAQTPTLPPPQQQQQQQHPQQQTHQQQQQPYPYSQQPFLAAHDPTMHTQSHSPIPSQSQAQRDTSLPYPHRRSLTEPQGFRTIVNQFPHLPNPVHGISHGIRLPSPPRLQDGGSPSSRAVYGNDGRINLMS